MAMVLSPSKITVEVRNGGIGSNYLSVTSPGFRNFFPEKSFGGDKKKDSGKLFSIYLEGLNKTVETDITPSNILRTREDYCWTRFFDYHGLNHENKAVIEKLSDYSYKIYPQSLLSNKESKKIARIQDELNSLGYFNPQDIEDAREKFLVSIAKRKGQPKFRAELLVAYRGQCTMTGFKAIQALEAAHIHPYKGNDTNEVWNGLLLRADIHTLFDLYLITVHPETKEIIIAPGLKSTDYSYLEGEKLRLPKDKSLHPNKAMLAWHYEQCKWV